jgi:probable rRNA maturation factor
MPVKTNIHFFFQSKKISLIERTKLKAFLTVIFQKEGKKLKNLSYIFCSDKYLLKINQDYLKHNFYTDIITFNLSEDERIDSEIYISADRVKENAKSLKITLKQELLRVIIHGVLHLCDYSDNTILQKKKIRNKEDEYLLLYSSFHVKQ